MSTAGNRGPKNRYLATNRRKDASDAFTRFANEAREVQTVYTQSEREHQRARVLEAKAAIEQLGLFNGPAILRNLDKMLVYIEEHQTRHLGPKWLAVLDSYEAMLARMRSGRLPPLEQMTEEQQEERRHRREVKYVCSMARWQEVQADRAKVHASAFVQPGEAPPKPPRKKGMDE